jgi:thiamine biosynthesis lipoprotein
MKHLVTSKTTPKYSYNFEALGTKWAIETPVLLPPEIKDIVSKRLEQFDQTYSRFREDSLVMRMSQPGTYVFPADFPKLFAIYKKCYQLTDGLMTPLIGSLLVEAGYDKDYSLEPKQLHSPPELENVEWDGKRTIVTTAPICLDVGAAGKGYAVDIIAELLESSGITDYSIDASGDIRHRGDQSEAIGLEDPNDSSRVLGLAQLQNKSLCASASNRRAWNGMHHIFNPRSLEPVKNITATWAIAKDTLTADAMATALFFVASPKALQSEFDFSYVRVFEDRTIDYSNDFEGQLFI